ncbi:MAG: hypothetical protein ACTSRP_25915, partial [Candidatus Helarchaeota archaeon]
MPIASTPGNYSGNGQKMNITLHQSLVNTSTIEFTNLDNSNSFTEPFPKFSGYNTSFINITIEKLFAPNHTLIIEDDPFDDSSDVAATHVTSFTVNSNCYLINASFNLYTIGAETPSADIYLFNSTWTGTRSEPVSASSQIIGSFSSPINGWNKIQLTKTLLNNSKTENNTWFIGLKQTVATATLKWRYVGDGTNGDNSDAYYVSGGWQFESNDYECKIDISPLHNTPLPSQIGLKINNTTSFNLGYGKGYWKSLNPISSKKNFIRFKITADWWNVSLNITRVQINYTKTNIKAISNFKILGSGAIVQWNVSIPGEVNFFDSRISDFNTINFTIPANWLDATIKVFNNTIQIPSANIKKRLLGNGFREVQVLKTTNGTNWYLTANSTNLMSSIKMYKISALITAANFSDIVKFNATFSKKIVNGNVNLTIYSPQPRRLNHTKLLDISTQSPDSEFLVSTWDLSDNVTKYGIFQVLMHWDNGTDAGFLETTLTIYGDTELKIMTPPLPTYDASDVFNVRVYFNDTGLDKGISASNFSYSIENGSIRTDNINILGDGNYSVTIHCNDDDFNGYGPKTVYFYAEEHYYNNQSNSIQFTILGETNLVIIRPQPNAVFNSGDTINVTLLYNDTVKNIGISGANIQYSLNGGTTFRSDNVVDIGQGKYNITISASDSQFPSYGLNNLVFNVSKQYYYNQSKSLTIKTLGETSLTL